MPHQYRLIILPTPSGSEFDRRRRWWSTERVISVECIRDVLAALSVCLFADVRATNGQDEHRAGSGGMKNVTNYGY